MKDSNNIRQTGIKAIGALPWGSNICQFYKIKQDILDIPIFYLKAGLENNEFCIWVVSDFLESNETVRALKKAIPNIDNYLKKGQIEIHSGHGWYFKDGEFELERSRQRWKDKYKYSQEAGYDGMRIIGDIFWVNSNYYWDQFMQNKSQTDRYILDKKILTLYTYPLEKCSSQKIIQIIKSHQFALWKRHNKWDVIESVEHSELEEEES
jgi:hypothetical protein